MKSTWKGATYTTTGVLPLGGGHLWSPQWGTQVILRGCHNRGTPKNPVYTAWILQKTRSYYRTSPLGCFIRTTPKDRPVRAKWGLTRRR